MAVARARSIPAPNTVTWAGGPMGGAEVSCASAELAAKLANMRVVVTPAGTLYDQAARRPVRGVEVVQLPTAQRPTRRASKRK